MQWAMLSDCHQPTRVNQLLRIARGVWVGDRTISLGAIQPGNGNYFRSLPTWWRQPRHPLLRGWSFVRLATIRLTDTVVDHVTDAVHLSTVRPIVSEKANGYRRGWERP